VLGVVYVFSFVKHFFGHTSTQQLHWMHCILWIVQDLPALSTISALVGHFLWQIPQKIQSLI
jgi:hypothetical protein